MGAPGRDQSIEQHWHRVRGALGPSHARHRHPGGRCETWTTTTSSSRIRVPTSGLSSWSPGPTSRRTGDPRLVSDLRDQVDCSVRPAPVVLVSRSWRGMNAMQPTRCACSSGGRHRGGRRLGRRAGGRLGSAGSSVPWAAAGAQWLLAGAVAYWAFTSRPRLRHRRDQPLPRSAARSAALAMAASNRALVLEFAPASRWAWRRASRRVRPADLWAASAARRAPALVAAALAGALVPPASRPGRRAVRDRCGRRVSPDRCRLEDLPFDELRQRAFKRRSAMPTSILHRPVLAHARDGAIGRGSDLSAVSSTIIERALSARWWATSAGQRRRNALPGPLRHVSPRARRGVAQPAASRRQETREHGGERSERARHPPACEWPNRFERPNRVRVATELAFLTAGLFEASRSTSPITIGNDMTASASCS
jgi:hypothetical protein